MQEPGQEEERGERREVPLRAIVDSLQDGIVAYDETERIVFFNPAAQRILGVPTQELEAGRRTWVPLGTDGAPLPVEQRPVAITARTGRPCSDVDIGIRREDGTIAWTIVSTQALGEGPAASGRYPVVAAFTDVTERREAVEALERSNAELAQFAYVA